ncbi:hypothetical protein J2X69_001741 [Algoriphagus sp. 4150]|uniref:DUF4932 domain-containing protein n=1 Tax=Algoriphagus sp. 4150 TaxID=2817756 RepID=UPI0028612EC8|nr:DUF4932 domain-containing protein [Algoriphagus sp. 4150]MDR7129404.1 hypothetical protein [Algoriphagus sp. 4150]
MKRLFLYLSPIAFYMLLCCSVKENTHQITIVESGVDRITYSIGQNEERNWIITPELNPDRLFVECPLGESQSVVFVTDKDSVGFKVSLGDTIRFAIVLPEQDTAFTEIIGLRKNVNFNNDYVTSHIGKFDVEVPEVHELVNIAVAISEIGQQDSNLVDMTTLYYRQVMEHFLPFNNHPLLETINRNITEVLGGESYNYYYALKMNACGYNFTNADSIVNKGIIYKMDFSNNPDPIEGNEDLFMDFAEKTNFREFYKSQSEYYDSLKQMYEALNPVDKMWAWLEGQFPEKYNYYHITFSPLVHGAHSAQTYMDNGFRQISMFVAPAKMVDSKNNFLNEMRNSRVVFTEIDHGYVNPISDMYAQQINDAFGDKEKWAMGENSGLYSSPVLTFNEYMTWAVFSLYCLDTYPEYEVYSFIARMEEQMVDGRRFNNFKAFNRQLISLYKKHGNSKKVYELYPDILAWCAKQ